MTVSALRAWLWRLGRGVRAKAAGGPSLGERFPDFRLPDSRGRPRSLYEGFPDGAILWFTNLCEDCRGRVPLMEEARTEAGERLRLFAVSLVRDEDLLRWADAACSFPVLRDPEDVSASEMGLEHPPGTCPLSNLFVLDGRGRIVFKHHLSAADPEAFRRAWRALL